MARRRGIHGLDRSGLVDWLRWLTGILPLTFLTDAGQRVSNPGQGFAAVESDLIGLLVRGATAAVLAAWKFELT